MSFYRDRILPRMIHASMRQETFEPYRRRLTAEAEGRVLEIGVGSGLNLPLYSARATRIVGLDPSPKLLSMAHTVGRALTIDIELIEGSAEALPLEDRSIDTVVTSWTLCTIPDVSRALDEMRRVLKPSGRLLFVEHGRAREEKVVRWQDRLTPLWRRIAGGCHLNRPIADLIEASGFRMERIATGYMTGPKPMTFMYEGSARCARPLSTVH
jgi:ubiquinone/menaquinone biosynthesis C-methylase UbiE